MRRDMELVRQILLTIESHEHGYAPEALEVDGYTEAEIGYHVLLMMEAELLVGTEMTSMASDTPTAHATRLMWKGHEFLDVARSPVTWTKAKAIVSKAGGASFPVWVEVLTKVAAQAMGFPLP